MLVKCRANAVGSGAAAQDKKREKKGRLSACQPVFDVQGQSPQGVERRKQKTKGRHTQTQFVEPLFTLGNFFFAFFRYCVFSGRWL